MNVLELAGLTVEYRTRRSRKVILTGLDTSLEKGRLVGLVGPNGAGEVHPAAHRQWVAAAAGREREAAGRRRSGAWSTSTAWTRPL